MLKEEFEKDGVKIFPISAVSGKGISELLWYVNDLVKNAPDDVVEFEPEVDLDFHDNPDLPFEVSYNEEDDVYVIEDLVLNVCLDIRIWNQKKDLSSSRNS